MVTQYFDKEGDEISANLYKDLAADDSYRIVHAFENEKVRMLLLWTGEIKGADQMFRTSYPLFKVEQYDKLDGKWVESFESGKTLPTLRKAEEYYEDFVMRWTESYIDEDGEMHEIGNLLAPPEPPKPDNAPVGDYDFVAW